MALLVVNVGSLYILLDLCGDPKLGQRKLRRERERETDRQTESARERERESHRARAQRESELQACADVSRAVVMRFTGRNSSTAEEHIRWLYAAEKNEAKD